MTTSRRRLLQASLGLGQLALLDRFGLVRTARAGTDPGRPSRLLVLYLEGGCRFQTFFVPPGSTAEVASYIPPPIGDYRQEPVFFDASSVFELAPGQGGYAPLRMGRTWNPADPKDRKGFEYTPAGYGWVHYGLAARTTVLHGVDQGSFDHASSFISAMCGAPGAVYRAPAFVSVVANHLHRQYADSRPLPCVALRVNYLPSALDLPTAAAPVAITSFSGLSTHFSTDPEVSPWWKGHDARGPVDLPSFDGAGAPRPVSMTDLERFAAARVRGLRGRSSEGADAYLRQIHDGYAQASATLARDVVKVLDATKGAEAPKPDYAASYSPFGVTFGNANGGPDLGDSVERILRLLKSDLTSVVFGYLPEAYYDTHNGRLGNLAGTANLRAQMDGIARLLGQMQATPAPGRPGKSLYEDTLVVILSEFGRSWPRGKDQSSLESWDFPDDHFNYTSVVLTGGNAAPSRQIGGFDLSPRVVGQPVAIREESGDRTSRPPRSADVVATICDAFGMSMGSDFFIPGGYGVIEGATV